LLRFDKVIAEVCQHFFETQYGVSMAYCAFVICVSRLRPK